MKKYIRYIPLIFSLLLIFGLTFQNGAESKQLTESTQAVIGNVVSSSSKANWWNDYILMRKLGHIPEYLLLGGSAYFVFGKWLKAGIFCVTISFIDEVVKGLLPGREFDFIDMRFDLIGYAIGIALVLVGIEIWKKIKCKNIGS